MFIIIGGDGKEYGPVTTDQIRTWITAGRANLDTKAKALGSEEWRRLGDYAEFGGMTDTPPVIPPLPGTTSDFPRANAPIAATATVPLADRGSRLGARAIDWAIELVCSIPGAIILGSELLKIVVEASRGQSPDISQLDIPKLALGAIVLGGAWLALLVVQVWLLATRGQSIGKLLVGVRIVRFADGGKAGIVYAWLLREVPMTFIGMVLGFVPFIGPVMIRPAFHVTDWCMIFRDDQRCLHDLIAGTKVVRA